MTAGAHEQLAQILIRHSAHEKCTLLEIKLFDLAEDLLIEPAGFPRQHKARIADVVMLTQMVEGVQEAANIFARFNSADEEDILFGDAVFLLHSRATVPLSAEGGRGTPRPRR